MAVLQPLVAIAAAIVWLTWCARWWFFRSDFKRCMDKIPSHVFAQGPNTPARYLLEQKQFLREGYSAYSKNGGLWKFKTMTSGRYKVILTRQHLKELKYVPSSVASWGAAFEDFLLLRYTGCPKRAAWSAATLRTQLTRRLDKLAPSMAAKIDEVLARLLKTGEKRVSVEILGLATEVVAAVTNAVFCGKELAGDDEWVQATARFSNDAFNAGYDLRPYSHLVRYYKTLVLPSCIRIRRDRTFALAKLAPILRARKALLAQVGAAAPDDGLQWLLEAAGPDVDAQEFADTVVRIMVAAIHATSLALTNAIADLLYRPEIIPELVKEATSVLAAGDIDRRDCSHLVKLDSVIKESMRMSPSALNTAGRLTACPYKFKDGTEIPPNVLLIAPAEAIHFDSDIYESAETFKPFRFVATDGQNQATSARAQFANATEDFLEFGYGSQACPGRWFAAQEMKMILARLLVDYDMKYDEISSKGPPQTVYIETGMREPTRYFMTVGLKTKGGAVG